MKKVKWHKILSPEVEIFLKFFFSSRTCQQLIGCTCQMMSNSKLMTLSANLKPETFRYILSYLILLYFIISYLIFVIRNTVTTFMTCPVSSTYLVPASSIRFCNRFKLKSTLYLSFIVNCITFLNILCAFLLSFTTYHMTFTLVARASFIRFPYFVFLFTWHNKRKSNVT